MADNHCEGICALSSVMHWLRLFYASMSVAMGAVVVEAGAAEQRCALTQYFAVVSDPWRVGL